MLQFQSQLHLARRPYLFKSTMKKKLVGNDSKVIPAHIAKCGTYSGYKDGEFTLTRKQFDRMILNFEGEKNPLPVYFGHSDTIPSLEEPEAKGWILALERKGDDLWAKVECTTEMEQKIQEGKFRYTSIFCSLEETHRETGKKIGARLVSLAITNAPFIDGLTALSLSNISRTNIYQSKDIAMKIDLKKNAEKILTALELDNTEERLSALEVALQEMMPEEEAPKEAPEEEGEEEAAGLSPEQMEALEALRMKASEILGEELDLDGLLAKLDEMLVPAPQDGEEMAATANDRKVDGPEAVGIAASNQTPKMLNSHPAFLALKKELDDYKVQLSTLLKEKEEREEAEVEALVLSAIDEGKILDTSKDHWIKAMKMDKELALSLLGDMSAVNTNRITKPNAKDGKKLSQNVIALSDHEQRILSGAGLKQSH